MQNPKNAYLAYPLVSWPPAFFTPKGGRAEQKKIDCVDRKLKQLPGSDAETPQAIKNVLKARLNEADVEHEMKAFLDRLGAAANPERSEGVASGSWRPRATFKKSR